jgi:Flp pilus assembly protein TadG
MKFFRGRPSTGRHRSRGQAVVEFALIVPLFIMLLAGMIDFGIGLYRYMVIISATRDGARAGSIACGAATPSCSSVITARVNGAVGGLNLASLSIACVNPDNTSCNSGSAKDGGSVTVTSVYIYHMVWPLAFGTDIRMSSTAKFMVIQ